MAGLRKRMLYVLGKIADLEVSLRNLAAAKEDGAYSQAMANRAKAAAGNLDDIKEIIKELDAVSTAFKQIKLISRLVGAARSPSRAARR